MEEGGHCSSDIDHGVEDVVFGERLKPKESKDDATTGEKTKFSEENRKFRKDDSRAELILRGAMLPKVKKNFINCTSFRVFRTAKWSFRSQPWIT